MRKVLLIIPVLLAGCADSAQKTAYKQLAEAWKECSSGYRLAQGRAFQSEACMAQALYKYGNEAQLSGMAARLEVEPKRLEVAKAVDQGAITAQDGALEMSRLDAYVGQRVQQDASQRSLQRREGVSEGLFRIGAATAAAGRPYSSVTNCSAVGPNFATCTSSGY